MPVRIRIVYREFQRQYVESGRKPEESSERSYFRTSGTVYGSKYAVYAERRASWYGVYGASCESDSGPHKRHHGASAGDPERYVSLVDFCRASAGYPEAVYSEILVYRRYRSNSVERNGFANGNVKRIES